MLDLAQRFAAADPASTPPDAPLPDEALALLDRVMTPRAPRAAVGRPVLPRPSRWRMPRLAIAFLVPALLLATLAAMGWFGWFLGRPAAEPMPTATPAASPSPAWSAFTTERELVEASDAILVADTIGTGTIELNGESYWLADVRVLRAGKGGFTAGETLRVTWPASEGGSWPGALEVGNRALLFLTTPGAAGTDASLVNPAEGSYLLVDDLPDPIPDGESTLELDAGFLDRMGLRVP